MIYTLRAATSLRIVCHGSVADVRMTEDVYELYTQAIDGKDKISLQRCAHLRRYFGEFANNGDFWRRMGQDKLKKEGNFSDENGGKIAVWCFKTFQWRLYGGITEVAERRCFVGVAVDPSKKRNRANQEILAAAARRLGYLSEFMPEGRQQ